MTQYKIFGYILSTTIIVLFSTIISVIENGAFYEQTYYLPLVHPENGTRGALFWIHPLNKTV